MGVERLVLASDVDPAARQETKRCHTEVILRDDCRRVTQEDIEGSLTQVAHLAMPCDSFTSAGPQRGRKDEDTNLLEDEAKKLSSAYGGLGVPVITFENVMEMETVLFPHEKFEAGLQRVFPQYWVRAMGRCWDV